MGREIKFRAWDKQSEFMFIIFDSEAAEDWYLPKWKDRYEVMQFTGLKDKNGKEIYEGDILHRDGYWDMYIVWDDKLSRFASLCTDWVVTQGKTQLISHELLLCYEVIGNIYERPELVESL